MKAKTTSLRTMLDKVKLIETKNSQKNVFVTKSNL